MSGEKMHEDIVNTFADAPNLNRREFFDIDLCRL